MDTGHELCHMARGVECGMDGLGCGVMCPRGGGIPAQAVRLIGRDLNLEVVSTGNYVGGGAHPVVAVSKHTDVKPPGCALDCWSFDDKRVGIGP